MKKITLILALATPIPTLAQPAPSPPTAPPVDYEKQVLGKELSLAIGQKIDAETQLARALAQVDALKAQVAALTPPAKAPPVH